MKGRCSRCGRPVAVPKPLAGMLLGPSCFAIVCADARRQQGAQVEESRSRIRSTPAVSTARAAEVLEVDPRQIALFEVQP